MTDTFTSEVLKKKLIFWFSKSIYTCPALSFLTENFMNHLIEKFKDDYYRYYSNEHKIEVENIELRSELIAILLYRISRELFLKGDHSCDVFSLLGRFLSGIEIYYSSDIGHGLKINHGIGTVIGARVKIGSNCLIHQNVTFGDKDGQRPSIGDNVTVYAGAKILGGITLGNNSIIGANTVCFINVPENKIAVGVPAKILSK